MRVLHLIDPGWPGGDGCSLRTLAEVISRLDDIEHDVVALGAAAHVDVARRCGLEPIGSVSLGGRARAVASVMNAYERTRGRYDLVHSWSQRAGSLAFAASPRSRHMVNVTRRPEQGRIATVLHASRARIIAPFESVRRAWIASGFRADSIDVVTPGVNEDALESHSTMNMNGAAMDRPFVIGMVHSPMNELDASVAMTIAARLALAGLNVRVMVHPAAPRRAEAEMVSHRLGFAHELLVVEDDFAQPWKVAVGLAAAVRMGGRRAGGDATPMLWAMAAGVPVVAELSGETRAVLEDGVTGFLVPAGDVNAACARLVRLCEDREAARQVAEAGRQRVRTQYNMQAYCNRLRAEYDAVLRR